MFQALFYVLCFGWAIIIVGPATAKESCDSRCQLLRETITKLKQSVVSIYTLTDADDDVAIEERFQGLGSGFFYRNCLIVTNAHVVGDADEIGVSISGVKRGLRAIVKAKDERIDIAILKLDRSFKCRPIKSAKKKDFALGTPVISVGNPMGLGWSVTKGIISASNRSLGAGQFHRYLQADAVIFGGNSGGPLLTLSGELLGVNTLATVNAGLGFSFPAYILDRILPELIEHNRLRPRYMGIKARQHKNENRVSVDDYFAGVKISKVKKGSPAYEAGIRKGDILVDIEGEAINSLDDLEMELYSHSIGSTVLAETISNGKKVFRRLKIKMK